MIVKTKSNKDGKIRYYEVFEGKNESDGFPFDAAYQQIKCENGEFNISSCPLSYHLKDSDEIIIEWG